MFTSGCLSNGVCFLSLIFQVFLGDLQVIERILLCTLIKVKHLRLRLAFHCSVASVALFEKESLRSSSESAKIA
jgi:hypothetical protein